AEGAATPIRVDADDVREYLGRPRFFDEVAERTDRPGVATGLAWTPVGGDVLFVEATMMPAEENRLILTGMLGDVMRESAQAALRAGISTVILPRRNEADLEEVPDEVRRQIRFVPVDSGDEVLANALEPGGTRAEARADGRRSAETGGLAAREHEGSP